MPQHNAFAWFYLGRFWWRRWRGRCWGTRKAAGNHAAMEHSGVSRRGGVRHWLLYVELWRYQVDAGTLGIMNNMHVPAGLLVNLAIWHQQPHWPSFITGAAVILASLWVHRKWVAPRSAQTADDRRRDPASSE